MGKQKLKDLTEFHNNTVSLRDRIKIDFNVDLTPFVNRAWKDRCKEANKIGRKIFK